MDNTTTFVKYYINSTIAKDYYNSASGAKRSTNASNKKLGEEVFACTTLADYYANVVHKVMVRNQMTGAMVEEDSNMPYSCSVASDAFWQN